MFQQWTHANIMQKSSPPSCSFIHHFFFFFLLSLSAHFSLSSPPPPPFSVSFFWGHDFFFAGHFPGPAFPGPRIFFSHRSCGHPVRTHLHTANQSYMIWIWMTCVFGIRVRMRVDLLFYCRGEDTRKICILELSLSIYVQNNGDLRLSYCTVLSFRISYTVQQRWRGATALCIAS